MGIYPRSSHKRKQIVRVYSCPAVARQNVSMQIDFCSLVVLKYSCIMFK